MHSQSGDWERDISKLELGNEIKTMHSQSGDWEREKNLANEF
jgi:hypothetical protein